MTQKTICWFRNDLRTGDNHALANASKCGEVVPLYIVDETDRELGSASKWWLHHSLKFLSGELGGMVLKRGKPDEILRQLLEETGADAVYWNRSYEPHTVKRDTDIKTALKKDGYEAKSFTGSIIHEPWEIETGSGGPYKVYTPFWKSVQAKGFPEPLPRAKVTIADIEGIGDELSDWKLLPTNPDWADGWEEIWAPGEHAAHERLEEFMNEGIENYGELRNRPDLPNVSRLSPHIHFGEISPRQLISRAYFLADKSAKYAGDVKKFVAEIAWRDFANHLLYHFPEIPDKNWKPAFDDYPWQENKDQLEAWQRGMTGYPMVDAGMRELWHTGYMHNRIRMLVGSFLVKHLRMHWKHGEAWFWNTLLDADLANNTSSWQWIAGSGADAAPYFRIFNPLTQGPKFDPNGDYVRKWCPEIANLPTKYLHAPHEAPEDELSKAGIELGKTYPLPIVDHKQARQAALDGYEAVKKA
ncbi:MAG: deoxyribodipyrimidine photo-lyase [Pseudomonadota bacterium]